MGERSSYPDGEPCWADVVTPDPDGARASYQTVFGWQFRSTAPGSGSYTMALIEGRPVAGIAPPRPGTEPARAVWTVYLASSDVDATAAERATAGGGQVTVRPFDSPQGRVAILTDPYGATFAILDPSRRTTGTG